MKRYGLAGTIGLLALMGLDLCLIPGARAIEFTPPDGSGAPRQSTGGASRSSAFMPPSGQGSPSRGTSGASRGSLFVPLGGQGAPSRGSSGASRGVLFQPAPTRRAPQGTSGGASRGDLFVPAASQGAPTQTVGASSRVGSLPSELTTANTPNTMLALLPQSFYGTTLTAKPTFLVYVPASSAKSAMFSLKDEAGNQVSQVTVPISGAAGVLTIDLPSSTPALEVDKNYQWFLALKIDGNLTPSTPYVDGWVRRIKPSPELAAALKQVDGIKRATVLGQNGVWYDCVATLATLRMQQPARSTLEQSWSELLSSVNLQQISQAPMLTSTKLP
jgi:Domain of Unknown Function (DUF928)